MSNIKWAILGPGMIASEFANAITEVNGSVWAVISLTMRAKQPKKGVVAGEKAYITVDNFPRADKATITYPDGTVEIIEAGASKKALIYEVEDMENCIANKDGNNTLKLSMDVIDIMDNVRNQWGIKYPFE
ncbi:hypothetical protein [Clostridium akagii]|uniref:hypothetical protein n=1 Tax=Clostridium akagii TaxID=91623 RepID=UPI000A878F30|nr:hypothetical protein [Clostridium akagii]